MKGQGERWKVERKGVKSEAGGGKGKSAEVEGKKEMKDLKRERK